MKFIITLATKKPFISSDDIETMRENIRAHIIEERKCGIEGCALLADEEPTVDFEAA